ncbi:MAG: AI-2E family transporter [Gammaproteobacteria bacterium]|nr:AI-2E family transporter [Gammaproteobacteria bacterium]
MNVFKDWFTRYFSDPQAILLSVLIVLGLGTVLVVGDFLAPVLVSLVLAYLLEGIIRKLVDLGAKRNRCIVLVYLIFLASLTFLILGLSPLLWSQVADLIGELPNYLKRGQAMLMALPQNYSFITEEQIHELVQMMQSKIAGQGQYLLSLSLSSIPGLFTLIIYLILVPLLVFFFLKDKEQLLRWFVSFLPKERKLSSRVWDDVNLQIGNYIRGKFWEILIVGSVTFIAFAFMGLKYSVLLGVIVGLSVLVPYIGAAVVTLPVAIVGFFQFGWSTEFAWIMGVYALIQALDGNILVPLLFSEVVNLHPVAIIVAVLFFGGIWGFWGVFFAIPLATLVSAIITAWPRPEDDTALSTVA